MNRRTKSVFPLVPTLCVGMPSGTLCVPSGCPGDPHDAERRRRRSHAERKNETEWQAGGDRRGVSLNSLDSSFLLHPSPTVTRLLILLLLPGDDPHVDRVLAPLLGLDLDDLLGLCPPMSKEWETIREPGLSFRAGA